MIFRDDMYKLLTLQRGGGGIPFIPSITRSISTLIFLTCYVKVEMLLQFLVATFLFTLCAWGLPGAEHKRAPCPCPLDKFGDTGVAINNFQFFSCAFQAGTCDWNVNVSP